MSNRNRLSTRILATALAAACAGGGQDVPSGDAPATAEAPAAVDEQMPADAAIVDVPEDSVIFARTVEWARSIGVDTLPIGSLVVTLGERFLGAPYVAGSLDPPGPERLVINLRAFDCVTYVESMLSLARAIRDGAGPGDYRRFALELMQLRYRNGGPVSYSNRLHYFSEWIASNAAEGRVEDITETLGGSPDPRPIDFMSTHVTSYPQLADSANRLAIEARERMLAGTVRHRIAEGDIERAASGIQAGDVIAATSTVEGLDVAHTGLAVQVNGRIHLMHAPLAGGVVEVSEVPLAERIVRISGQDGIMVARPR